jgi:hypothetical protein
MDFKTVKLLSKKYVFYNFPTNNVVDKVSVCNFFM